MHRGRRCLNFPTGFVLALWERSVRPKAGRIKGRTEDYARAIGWFRRGTNGCAADFFILKTWWRRVRNSRLLGGLAQSIARAACLVGLHDRKGDAQVGRGDAVLARASQHVADHVASFDRAALLEI